MSELSDSELSNKPRRERVRADLSGRQLGDFRLLRRLGRGAMAEVYLAEQLSLRRRVAVKILKTELADDRTYLRRFEREAHAAASLVHANIVQIYEVGHVDGLRYIAQEYVQGQNLHEWISRNGPPGLPLALSIMGQVAAALVKAAEQGVVHRDIKPENIMLTQSGEVKVADFGLARVTREGEAAELTQVGMTMGTPLYMSPEQVQGRRLDPRSDLYSFGVTCYHMLAGSPPFRSETALGVAVQHLKTRPEPLENCRPDLPPALCRLVHQMLVKDPERRCQAAREVLRDLRRLHTEHLDGNWPEDLSGWETAGVELPVDTRKELTEQLGNLMKTVALQSTSLGTRLALWLAIVGAFLLGGAIAWWATVERPLLAGVAALPPSTPIQKTALEQYLYASRIQTEDAWQSVIKHFPDNKPLTPRAERELARLYLLKGDYDRAMAIFGKLADESETDPGLRAFGLAGQCGVLTLQGKHRESVNLLEQFWPIRSELRDQQMRDLIVNFVVIKNNRELKEQGDKKWDEWLKQQSEDD